MAAILGGWQGGGVNKVLQAIEDVSKDTLPVSVSGGTHSSKKRTPGWCEFVQPWLEESKFWNCLWESAGKPAEGDLSNAMRQAKQQYKYAVRFRIINLSTVS